MEIKKAAVIGAGVMGGGIAAHIANAGIPVVLMDIVPKGANNRNVVAETAIEKLKKSDPRRLHAFEERAPGHARQHRGQPRHAGRVRLDRRGGDREARHQARPLRQGRDSTGRRTRSSRPTPRPFRSAQLIQGRGEDFAKNFLITHFFNPPRYMRLLEIVAGPKTKKAAVDTIRDFADLRLGKGVVDCKDTPGFIANRIGTLWIQAAVNEAIDGGLTVEEAELGDGPADRLPEDRHLRPDRFGRPRPHAACQQEPLRQRAEGRSLSRRSIANRRSSRR